MNLTDGQQSIVESQAFRLLGISGSLREGSFSTAILRAMQALNSAGTTLEVRTLHDIPLYNQDLDKHPAPGPVTALREAVAASEGVIISTTEYNHGIPGVLKNALDWASRPAFTSCFKAKPVLIVTCGTGHLGGSRVQGQLREVLVSMLARVVPLREIVISDVASRVSMDHGVEETTLAHLDGGLRALRQEIGLLKGLVQHSAESVRQ